MAKKITLMLAGALSSLPLLASALTFSLSPHDSVVGQTRTIYSKPGERIYDVARQNEMGFYEMIVANPNINRHSPIPTSDPITIPSEFVLPNTPHEGIVINLPELRLYYYPKGQHVVRTEPIAIGRYNWETPTLKTKIIGKKEKPAWFVPKSIKEASARKGIILPDVVKPGPKNPLGTHALRLGSRSYLIHGTNAPTTIGKRASSGCMRMYPEDIKTLFGQVPVGTPVRIVDEFFKLGWRNNVLYLEVHEPLQETAEPEHVQIQQINNEIEAITRDKPIHINWSAVHKAIEEQSGLPVAISTHVNYQTQPYEDFHNSKDEYFYLAN